MPEVPVEEGREIGLERLRCVQRCLPFDLYRYDAQPPSIRGVHRLVEGVRDDKRYTGTDKFEQAQHGFDKHIDDDRMRKVADRAADRENKD